MVTNNLVGSLLYALVHMIYIYDMFPLMNNFTCTLYLIYKPGDEASPSIVPSGGETTGALSFIPSGALLQVFRRGTSIVSGIATRPLSQVTRDRVRMATPAAGRPPMVENETLAKLVSELYPFKAVKQLPSYDDRNYYFRGTTEEKGEGEEFVLKLYSTQSSSLIEQL